MDKPYVFALWVVNTDYPDLARESAIPSTGTFAQIKEMADEMNALPKFGPSDKLFYFPKEVG